MQKISEEIQELKAQGERYDLDYANQGLLDRPMSSHARRRVVTVSVMPQIKDDVLKSIDEICVRTTSERIAGLFDCMWEEWILDAIKVLEKTGINTPEQARFFHIIHRNKVYDETISFVPSAGVKLYEIPYVLNPSNEYCKGRTNGRFNPTQMELLLKNDGEYKVSSYKEEGSVIIAVRGESVVAAKCECSTYYTLLNQTSHDGLMNIKTAYSSMSWFGNANVRMVLDAILNSTVPAADQSGVPDGYKEYNSSRVSHLAFVLETAKNYEWLFYRIAYALERHAISKSIEGSPVKVRQKIRFMECLKDMRDINRQYMTDADNDLMSSVVKNW